jgi:hypothetical protein
VSTTCRAAMNGKADPSPTRGGTEEEERSLDYARDDSRSDLRYGERGEEKAPPSKTEDGAPKTSTLKPEEKAGPSTRLGMTNVWICAMGNGKKKRPRPPKPRTGHPESQPQDPGSETEAGAPSASV